MLVRRSDSYHGDTLNPALTRPVSVLMDTPSIRDFIAASAWFHDAPDDVLDALASASTLRHYPANSHLWRMGDTNTEIFGVVTGRVQIYVSAAMGQEFAVTDLPRGSWGGESCLKDTDARTVGARTLVSSEILLIPKEAVLLAAGHWSLLYRNLWLHQVVVCRGLFKIVGGMFQPLEVRVAKRLIELAKEHGRPIERGVLIAIKVTQSDLARLAKGSRQRVNRIFRDWSKRGLIETHNKLLLIPDMAAFEQEFGLF